MDPIGTLLIKLRKLLRSRGRTPDDTDDLIQEAFLRLQLYCKDKPVEQPEAFLVRTALNSIEAPGRWAAMLYGNNLNNERGAIQQAPFNVLDWTVRPRPRTIGLQLEYRFE